MGAIVGILGEGGLEEVARMLAFLATSSVWCDLIWRMAPGLAVGCRPLAGRARSNNLVALAGWLTNRAEVARELRLPGRAEDPDADPELIERIYRRDGPAGFGRLDGPFALALWDERNRHLVLARDRWALAPLYITRLPHRIAFASEYKALLALNDLAARPDLDAIQYVQATKNPAPRAACLAGVRPVPGGHWLALGFDGEEEVGRFINVSLRPEKLPEDAHAARLRTRLVTAAGRSLAGQGRIGLSLSSGLDSTVTLAALRRAAPQLPVRCFTSGASEDDPALDAAANIAAALGSTHTRVVVDPRCIAERLPELVWRLEDPIGRDEMLFYDSVARAATGQVDILLNGHFADTLFGGMPRHRLVDLMRRAGPFTAPLQDLYAYTQVGAAPRSPLGWLAVAVANHGHWLLPPRIRGAGVMPPAGAPDMRGPDPLNALVLRSLDAAVNPFGAITRLHLAVGLRVQAIYFDAEVVDTALAIPGRLKIVNGCQKHILRRAGEGLLPPRLTKLPKGMLRLPRDRRLRTTLDAVADDHLAPATVRDRGLVEPGYVDRLRCRLARPGFSMEETYRLWSLLLLEQWCRTFLDARGRRPTTAGHEP